MGRLRVTVRSDGLAAELSAGLGPPVTVAEISTELGVARVVHGIDAQALDDLTKRLADPNCKVTQVVAQGVAPVHGTDGTLAFAFEAAPLAGTAHADGSIDFSERGLLHPAAAGQEVARIVLPTTGTPGRSVRGESIASKPGRPFTQRLGPGVQATATGIVAIRPGVIVHTTRQVDVVSLHTHEADVDMASGNLHSPGSLLVRGDVCEGFAAEASGDVQVTGAVLDGRVTAGGSVHVDQAILGTSCEVRAIEDITCQHAMSALLRAGRRIEILDEATHCRILADHISILGGRGVAFGGELRARQTIDLRVAGTPNGAPTRLSIGDPDDDRTELARHEADPKHLARSSQHSERGVGQKLLDAKATRMAARASDHSQQERLRVLQRQREMLRTAVIRITDTVHPGVVIQFGQVTMPITETLSATMFHFDTEQDAIVRGPLP